MYLNCLAYTPYPHWIQQLLSRISLSFDILSTNERIILLEKIVLLSFDEFFYSQTLNGSAIRKTYHHPVHLEASTIPHRSHQKLFGDKPFFSWPCGSGSMFLSRLFEWSWFITSTVEAIHGLTQLSQI